MGLLASGTGSILGAVLDAGVDVSVVVVDRKCAAIERAEAAAVPVEIVERTSFGSDFDRDGFTDEVVEVLGRHDVEVVVMAGFMTVLSAGAVDAFDGRVLNTHPSLLPSFPGAHGVRDALDYGVKVTGCTVHLATPDVDAGPILAQQAVPVLDDDTVESLHERIKSVERRLYPATIRSYLEQLEGAG